MRNIHCQDEVSVYIRLYLFNIFPSDCELFIHLKKLQEKATIIMTHNQHAEAYNVYLHTHQFYIVERCF